MYNSIYPININYRKAPLAQNKGQTQSAPESSEESQNNNQNTFPNGTKVSIDYSKGQINISQVVTDFRNTIIAINAPDDVKDEVYQYLNLVERESKKENPIKDIIYSNLKNASKVSDEFIAKSLNKQSNVVEGWIDALFMQNINLKADANEINPEYLLEFPKKAQKRIEENNLNLAKETQTLEEAKEIEEFLNSEEPVEIEPQQNQTDDFRVVDISNQPDYTSLEVENEIESYESEAVDAQVVLSPFTPLTDSDVQASELFSRAKKMPQTNEGDTDAINLLNEALGLMESEINSNQNIKAAIHYERGKIFDNYDYVDYALRDYFEATKTVDLNLKAQAYFKSGQIYDEFREYDPALDNYFSSVAYCGEADNYTAQTKVLSKIADLYAKQYDVEQVESYSNLALESAEYSDNDYLLAQTHSNNAQNFQYIGENDRALEGYKNALAVFSRTDESYEQMAYNYEQASIVMRRLGNDLKADKLQSKALQYYQLIQPHEVQQAVIS